MKIPNSNMPAVGLQSVVARAISGSAGLQIVGLALSFALGVLLSHSLGAAGYGTYAFAMACATFLGIPTEFGLPQLALRESSVAASRQDWPTLKGIIIFSTSIIFLSSFCIFVIAEFILSLRVVEIGSDLHSAIVLSVLLIPIVGQLKLLSSIVMGLGFIVVGQLGNLIFRPAFFISFLVVSKLITNRAISPDAALLMQILGTLIALALVASLLIAKYPGGFRGNRHLIKPRPWVRSAIPMALTEGLRVAQGQSALLILGVMSSTREVGLFRVADSTALMCAMPVSMLTIATASIFAKLHANQDKHRLQKLASLSSVLMVIGVTAICIPVWLFGRQLLALFFGTAFATAYPALVVSTFAGVIAACFGPSITVMNMGGQERFVTKTFLISSLTNIAISSLTIPFLGSVGASLGSSTGVFAWNFLLWRGAKAHLGIDTACWAAPLAHVFNRDR